jgi:hypothetical protein
MTKPAKRRKQQPEPEEDEVPFGFLPTADPPRKNVGLLAMAAVALVLWMLVLIYLSLGSR